MMLKQYTHLASKMQCYLKSMVGHRATPRACPVALWLHKKTESGGVIDTFFIDKVV